MRARPRLYNRLPMGLAELTRNAVDVLPAGGLEAKLKLGRPLRVKLGIDVTSPDIHVGRAIPLQRMRAFQDEGHVGVLIVGDYTTRIGDPSGRSAERPILSDEEIDRNAQHVPRAGDGDPRSATAPRCATTASGSSKLTYAEVVRLARTITVARMLERDDFAKRYAARRADLGLRAALPADAGVRLGRDRGRRRARRDRPALQPARRPRGHAGLRARAPGRADDAAPAVVGRREDELVGRQQHPADDGAGGAVRPDDADPRRRCSREWWRLVLERSVPDGDPMEAKLELARFIVARSHGEEAARAGRGALHAGRPRGRGARTTSPRRRCRTATRCTCRPLLADAFGLSTSEARRLIAQGGVKVDGDVVAELDVPRERLDGALAPGGKAPLRALRDTA